MFREMRRNRQAMTTEEIRRILEEGTSGVLALSGDGGYPYAVPLSYVYDGSRLYFHGARSGHKIDAIRRSEKASFCVVAADDVVPEAYTTRYKSVIVFGRIRILDDEAQIREAINKLALKYYPADSPEHRLEMIRREWAPLCMMEMKVEHMTGKQAKELIGQAENRD